MTWWHYLLLANVYLTLFFAFYVVFLRKETFFNLNRVYLVSSALLSFCIPVMQSDWIKTLFITQKVQRTIYEVGPQVMNTFTVHANAAAGDQLTMGQILLGVYVAGIIVLTIRFIYQLMVIKWVINQPGSETTYSFFNQVKLEDRDTDNHVITAHEQVHVRQWHSVDVLLLEAIMIANWFNPVVYLYRNAVKHIHEFIADRDALKAGIDKAEYAMLLLSQTFITPPYHLVNPFFNSSLLKLRIKMLQKNKSHWMMLVKYGLSAPLFGLMMVLSSATINNSKTIRALNKTANDVFSTPASKGIEGALSAADMRDLQAVIDQHQAAGSHFEALTSTAGKMVSKLEHNAEFPGGDEMMYLYLADNIRYPAEARQKNIQGKVYCTFVVEKDGSVTDIKILRGIGGGADEEAMRVLAAMPKWNPGVQNGENIRQQYTVPINFALSDKQQPVPQNAEAFTQVEQGALFPGGMDAFAGYISHSVIYPDEAREKKVQGRVAVSFVVETDGSISEVKALNDPGAGLANEALRVIKQSPKWQPAMQNGHLVRQSYTTPINFSLSEEKAELNLTTLADRRPDTSLLEARFISKVKTTAPRNIITDGKVSSTQLPLKAPETGNKSVNKLKDNAAKSMFGEKTTTGIVQIVTKHMPFFASEDNGN